MNDTFYTSLIGAKTFSKAIDIVGHNISNSNLSGYRAKGVEFSNLFTQSLGSASSGVVSSQKEYGSQVQASVMSRDQGSLMVTDSTFDLAIEGNGWFGTLDKDGNTMYTRNGSFNFDKNRHLVDMSGHYVTGSMAGNIIVNADATNNKLTGIVEDMDLGEPNAQDKIQLPNMLSYPKQYTDTVSIFGNLGLSNSERKFSTNLISHTEENNTLSLTVTKNENQPDSGSSWSVVATITDSSGKVTYDKKSGTLTFDAEGKILKSTLPELSNDGLDVAVNFGKGSVGLQANDSSDEAVSTSKNGHPQGELEHYGVAKDGNVIAFFDNGFKTVVAKVAIYHFRNEQGMQDIGGSYYMENDVSGAPLFYRDDAGGLITTEGLVLEHTLESSNMDNAEALSSLMILQKAFDASSRALKAGDDMIKQALHMDA
jgi:flagellar hook protein FlgE